MTVLYELWDLASGNQIESFDSEPEALDLVRKLLDVNGPGYIDDLALGTVRINGDGQTTELLPFIEGDELRGRLEASPAPTGLVGPKSRPAIADTHVQAGENCPAPPSGSAMAQRRRGGERPAKKR